MNSLDTRNAVQALAKRADDTERSRNERPLDLVARRASTITPERVSFLWSPWLPRKLVVCDGHPGQGKSTLSLEFAALASIGGPWPDGTTTTPTDVLIVNVEDGPADTTVPRLTAAGADLHRVHVVDGLAAVGDVDDPMPMSLAHADAVRRHVDKHGPVGLIVLDPLMALLPSGTNSYNDAEVRAVLRPWTTLADDLGTCVLVVRHLTKGSQGGPALLRGGGSVGIIGAARSGFIVVRHPEAEDGDETDGRRVLAPTKNNVARMPSSIEFALTSAPNEVARVVWGETSTLTAEQLLAPQESADDAAERSEVDRAILALFEEGDEVGARAAGQSLADAGFSKPTIARRRKALGIETVKSGMGAGWVWVRPPEDLTKVSKVSPSETMRSSRPSVRPSQGDTERLRPDETRKPVEPEATTPSMFDEPESEEW